MRSHLDTPLLESLAQSLASTFPGSEDAPLARALLRALAGGEPVSNAALAAAADRTADEVDQTVAGWPNLRRDEQGRIDAFGGLSLRPTEHRFDVAGRTLYTWCAWDTLFLPRLLGQDAQVESTCPVTNARVTLAVAPERLIASRPDDIWVSFPPPGRTSTASIVESFCCHVHFLAGQHAAVKWVNAHDGLAYDLDDAFELGRLATRALSTRNGDV